MEFDNKTGTVLAVCKKAEPGMPKKQTDAIELVEDHGVDGDYHAGKTVRHRNLVKKDPSKPNHRQVLIVDTVIFEKIKTRDINLTPGLMGENILLNGIDLMSLEMGTRLEIGSALLELTDVRKPCYQLNESHPELLKAVVEKVDQEINLNAGVFARVLKSGHVRAGDLVEINS
jgi:MOSC domain-containing protein YiiM